ncbi:hypothetical protein BC826DRAFT_44438 [Russula brevipes]|nr:hypothetical protein BC826DRAFT_44438 [Russula brevipes]
MKFARYLDNSQAPEWKRAYIDYRGLKKRIKVIQRAEGGGTEGYLNTSSESDPDPSPSGSGATAHVSDEQDVADEGHDADDETNIHSERRRQTARMVVMTRLISES